MYILLCIVHCKGACFARWELMQTKFAHITQYHPMCMSTKITENNATRNVHVLILIRKYIRVKLLTYMCVERDFALSHIRALHVKYMFLKAHSYT